ncbi:MAG: hypothetical protein ABIH39_04360 [Candidatus Margulisiibacteriota bacterium]
MIDLLNWQTFIIFFAGFTVGYFLRSAILLAISVKQLKKIREEEQKVNKRVQQIENKIRKHAEKMGERLGID